MRMAALLTILSGPVLCVQTQREQGAKVQDAGLVQKVKSVSLACLLDLRRR